MIYLDYSATTPPDPRVLQTFLEVGGACGNYNASNAYGRGVKAQLDAMVQQLQVLLGTTRIQNKGANNDKQNAKKTANRIG